MTWIPVLLTAGAAGAIALVVGSRKAAASVRTPEPSPQPSPMPTSTPTTTPGGSSGGGRLQLRLTTYWPYAAKTEAEQKMEGGVNGAALWRGRKVADPFTGKRPVLYTLEDAIDGTVPYGSLAGDPAVWPVGQRIEIDAYPGVTFRVVDTGANFKGSKKKYREEGSEPIDVCVRSRSTKTPRLSGAKIVRGDNWEGGALVAVANLKGQSVVVGNGYAILGGGFLTDCLEAGEEFVKYANTYTDADREALSRAIESCCSRGSIEEKQAVGWACRNRAARLGVSIFDLLAPEGVYGPRGDGGRDFVSTELDPTEVSTQVAKVVLVLPQEDDPTGGAVDFWNPGQQSRARVGTVEDDIPSEGEVREVFAACGMRVIGAVGELELLA